MRIPVNEWAAIKRINRKFRSEDVYFPLQLRKTRSVRDKCMLGDFYVLNPQFNFIPKHHVDPESLARELGVLTDWEHVRQVEDELKSEERFDE